MKRINVVLLAGAALVFGLGYMTSRVVYTPDNYAKVMFENDSLRYVNTQKDSLISQISEEKLYFENQVDEMYDELDAKEMEISYIGHKLDSAKFELNKRK